MIYLARPSPEIPPCALVDRARRVVTHHLGPRDGGGASHCIRASLNTKMSRSRATSSSVAVASTGCEERVAQGAEAATGTPRTFVSTATSRNV